MQPVSILSSANIFHLNPDQALKLIDQTGGQRLSPTKSHHTRPILTLDGGKHSHVSPSTIELPLMKTNGGQVQAQALINDPKFSTSVSKAFDTFSTLALLNPKDIEILFEKTHCHKILKIGIQTSIYGFLFFYAPSTDIFSPRSRPGLEFN
ncbi:hypothetical protein OIDMADRAFT_58376 [Oidiodendron maius Zn]|uniref:Uncharacterized protein n=1 Tax=Oidiodendron maius (strain Zn) TaxID=913774 RepID=A0A0C3H2Q2_OIDMZ|nr:hypothetical protein OIDMADRAFT_58376 [Oidiodendron maius Zn]